VRPFTAHFISRKYQRTPKVDAEVEIGTIGFKAEQRFREIVAFKDSWTGASGASFTSSGVPITIP